jgi:adenosylcobinamide-GDP ribazoletransferase
MRRLMRRRLGGYTGDCLGAVQQVAEVAFLLGMLVALAAGAQAVSLPGDEDS